MRKISSGMCIALLVGLIAFVNIGLATQESPKQQGIDEKVTSFLEKHRRSWQDMNVPMSDGKLLHDLIIKNEYTRALEIGTSTGHSTVWIAWAMSKTGGKVVTIEIDEGRYRQALKNFEEAGVSTYIDARLADAHALVKELEGTFDFVFCDADKDWYKNYFVDVYPKLVVGGCYTAHNISEHAWSTSGTGEYYNYVKNLPDMQTTLDSSGGGVSISYKKSVQ